MKTKREAKTPEARARGSRGTLPNLVSCFSAAMLEKLKNKQRQGFDGWNASNRPDSWLESKLMDHVARAMRDPKQWVDVANFAAFLWWRSVCRAEGESDE